MAELDHRIQVASYGMIDLEFNIPEGGNQFAD